MPTTVYFASRARGFFLQLFNSEQVDARFIYNKNQVYETNTKLASLKNRLGRSTLFDHLGVIQTIKCSGKDCDIYGSFNRFLRTDKPYFIYVENPAALYHYKLNRAKTFFGKRNLDKLFSDPNLRGLIFMSNACKSTFENVCHSIPSTCFIETIYPYIPLNSLVSESFINGKSCDSTLRLLYIAQGIRFLSKGALEVVEMFKRLKNENYNIELHIITSFKEVSPDILDSIRSIDGITLDDFRFNFNEMQHIYSKAHIFLQPTSDDSCSLTILEALKSGLPIIASRLYSIPEIVEDGKNGFLCDPHYWFFDKNNIPNPEVWNHRKQTIYSGKMSYEIVDFLCEKVKALYENRNLLADLSVNSLHKANSEPFSTEFIATQWNKMITEIANHNV